MRIAVGGLLQESNAFAAPSTRADFVEIEPDRMLRAFRDTSTEIAGFVDAATAVDADIVPLGFVYGESAGPIDDETAIGFVDRLVERVASCGADVVLLALHGSMTAVGIDDVDGLLLAEIRAAVGADVVIAATLDWHCSITPAMVDAADLLAAYRTYPHIDQRPRARHAAEQAIAAHLGMIRPVAAARHPPMIIAGPSTAHENEPMRSILEEASAIAARVDGVIDWSICPGFARSDVPLAGVHVYVATDDDHDAASRLASDLSLLVWERRSEFLPRLLGVEEALRRLVADPPVPGHPVVVSDQGDNPGGGAAADSTVLLDALLAAGVRGAVVCALTAPDAVATAHRVGVGGTIAVDGRTGTVEHLADGRYTMRSPTHDGVRRDVGPTATVAFGSVRAVLTSSRVQNEDLEFLRMAGVDPAAAAVLVVKSNAHFRAAFAPIAADILDVDTPGLSTPHLERLPYRRIDRPVFPLDDPQWRPTA